MSIVRCVRSDDGLTRPRRAVQPDVERLRALAADGFVSDELRKRVWPVLLGLDPAAVQSASDRADKEQKGGPNRDGEGEQRLGRHAYVIQVEKDVPRSLHHFRMVKAWRAETVEEWQDVLRRVLHRLFDRHPELHYVQGFNDVCSVVLLVCGQEELTLAVCERLAQLHLRDCLRPTLETEVEVLSLVLPLVAQEDQQVQQFLHQANSKSFFALSWVLTWFAHNIDDDDGIRRVYDFLLASHPLMVVYVAAALILRLRGGLLSVECDYPAVHEYFQHLPPDLDVHGLIRDAQRLESDHPVEQLPRLVGATFPDDSPLQARSVRELVESGTHSAARRSRLLLAWGVRRVLVPLLSAAVGAAALWITYSQEADGLGVPPPA